MLLDVGGRPCSLTADYTEIGIGVKQELELAKRWYMRAASEWVVDHADRRPRQPACKAAPRRAEQQPQRQGQGGEADPQGR